MVHTREVPGNDLTDDTNRFVSGIIEELVVSLNDFTMVFISPSAIITKTSSDLGDIESFRIREYFT